MCGVGDGDHLRFTSETWIQLHKAYGQDGFVIHRNHLPFSPEGNQVLITQWNIRGLIWAWHSKHFHDNLRLHIVLVRMWREKKMLCKQWSVCTCLNLPTARKPDARQKEGRLHGNHSWDKNSWKYAISNTQLMWFIWLHTDPLLELK